MKYKFGVSATRRVQLPLPLPRIPLFSVSVMRGTGPGHLPPTNDVPAN